MDKPNTPHSAPSTKAVLRTRASRGGSALRKTVTALSLLLMAGTTFGLASCGGDDDYIYVSKVLAAGDSLNDVGTFGLRFTVGSGDATAPNLVWTDKVAEYTGAGTLCPAYQGSANGSGFKSVAGCTGYAVGGAQINPATLQTVKLAGMDLVNGATLDSDSTPQSIVQQIKDMGAAHHFVSTDLVLVDGGGNDMRVLAGSLFPGLDARNPLAPDALAAYKTVLKDLLPATVVDAAASPEALAQLGGAYMQKTAGMLAQSVRTELLDKGARRVVVLNTPNLAQAPALNKAPEQAKAIAGAWSAAYNAELQKQLGGDGRIEIADLHKLINDWTTNPAAYGFSNAVDKACGNLSIETCTAQALTDKVNPNWNRYLFADALHATPYGNEKLALAVTNQIRQRGWN